MTAPTTWAALRDEIARRFRDAGIDAGQAEAEARWVCEQASGFGAGEWHEIADATPAARARGRVETMVGRRVGGEPLQYVLGEWSFRGLDLMVDARVLIPRPETEWVVEVALEEATRLGLRRGRRSPFDRSEPTAVVADLGTGSGAIALALEAELPDAEVWATDASDEALQVARANVAGCGAARVRTAGGEWFAALPGPLRGRLALVVSNPPYVAEAEVASLPSEVAEHEPRSALVSGPTGLEALEVIIAEAPGWLADDAVLVCEIAPHQAKAVVALATAAGYAEAEVRRDLAGRDRMLVARRRSARA